MSNSQNIADKLVDRIILDPLSVTLSEYLLLAKEIEQPDLYDCAIELYRGEMTPKDMSMHMSYQKMLDTAVYNTYNGCNESTPGNNCNKP